MTPEQFFKQNSKWFVIVLFSLFMIKTFQTCNRNITIKYLNTELTHLSDSLNTQHAIEVIYKDSLLLKVNDSIKELNYRVKLAVADAEAANRRAKAVQSTAEKTRSNTTSTIVVKGVEQIIDSTNIKKEAENNSEIKK